MDLAGLFEFRDLLVRLTVRDLKLRYKQTALGVAWVIVQPLLAAGVFTFVFGRVAKLPSDGVSYFVFAYAGMTIWSAFSQTVTKASGSLVGNSQLVSKIYFPRLILPMSGVGTTAIDFLIASSVGLIITMSSGYPLGVRTLALPVWLVLGVTLGLSIGLVASALMVEYRDVGYVLPVMTQLLLYATPVAYSAQAVPADLEWVVTLNPLTVVIEGFRWSMLGTPPPSFARLAFAVGLAAVLLYAAALFFKSKERAFSDVI